MRVNAHVLEVRKQPQQIRSQRRVEKILAGAIEVFREVGFDAATTNEIAARAEVSIGSLYQFYPNKSAILNALGTRCLQDLRVLLDAALSADSFEIPFETLLDRVFAALQIFSRQNDGLFAAIAKSPTLGEYITAEHQFLDEVTRRLELNLAHRAPKLDPERRHVMSKACVICAHALFGTVHTSFRQAFILEAKAMILAYLEPVLNQNEHG
jgi:AcrR family transcriptional regulator